MTSNIWSGEGELPAYPANIATMINGNAKKFGPKTVYQEYHNLKFLEEFPRVYGHISTAT